MRFLRSISLSLLLLLFSGMGIPVMSESAVLGGGTLRLARGTDPQTLDPAMMNDMEDVALFPLLFLPLVDVTGGTNLVACAAASWSVSLDSRIFTFQLRPGLKFSNGREVLASDYAFAIKRTLDPATASFLATYLKEVRGVKEFMSGRTNQLAGVRAPALNTFVVELERPDPTFPYVLSCTLGTAVPREEVEGRGNVYAVRPVGNGPYMVKEWVRGSRLLLKRNPYYSGPEPQHFDRVDVFIGGDDTTRQMMFERGEADIGGFTLPRPILRRMNQDPRWRGLVEREPVISTYYVTLNTEIPPLDNLRVRQAINYAVDRDRRMGVRSGFYSHAEGPIPPGMPGFNPQLRGYRYDPEKSLQLLKDSGLQLPLRSELWHDPSDESRLIVQGIQWDLHQVGIEIELKSVAGSEMMAAAQTRGKVPMSLTYWSSAIPDPKDMLGMPFDGRAVTNEPTVNLAFYSNPQVTRLLDEAALEANWPLRFQLYQRAEELIVRDAPWIFLGHGAFFAIRQAWLKGPLLEPLWWLRFDRVWIEK